MTTLKPRFLPETSKVPNTKRGPRGAAQPRAVQNPPHCLHRAAFIAKLLTLERKGKAQGKHKERKKVNGKEGGMGVAHPFQPVDFNPSRPKQLEGRDKAKASFLAGHITMSCSGKSIQKIISAIEL